MGRWRGETLDGPSLRLGLTAPEMMRCEGPLFAWAGAQPDAREGVLAFLEKREPVWKLAPSRDLPERLAKPPRD